MRDAYIGIDPGAKGFVVIYDARESHKGYWKVPLASDELLDVLERFAPLDCIAVIEKVGAMPGQGRTSIFTFGYNAGRIVGILEAMGIAYTHVVPQVWQREMWDSGDKVTTKGKVDNKKTSYNAARRLHPNTDFRRTENCTTFDDNLVDATLLCDYGMRKNL